MKYIKKPIPIEAVQWTGYNYDEICSFMKDINPIIDGANNLFIHTLEGDMRTEPGSYIIRGPVGEYYPCRKDIFEDTYTSISNVTRTCPICKKDFSINYSNIFYDALSKKYKYWTICPYCGTKNDWE